MNDTGVEVVRVTPTKNRGGEWVRIGDAEFRIPPLGFMQLADLQDDVEDLRTMGNKPSREQMLKVAKIVHAAMSRNYPDLAFEEAADMLDIGNYQTVLIRVLGISGFKQADGGAASGEPFASIGAASTPG